MDSKVPSENGKCIPSTHHAFVGKVALLIGDDATVLQSLALRLARRGADIALVCPYLPLNDRQQIAGTLRLLGQRFLYLKKEDLAVDSRLSINFINQLVKIVNLKLGGLDIFIDLSSEEITNKQEPLDRSRFVKPYWSQRQAVFAELARA